MLGRLETPIPLCFWPILCLDLRTMKFSIYYRFWLRGIAALAVVSLLIPGLALAAPKKPSRDVRRHSAHHRRRYPRRYRHYRRYDYYRRRYVRVEIPPARVREIQKALIKAGVLHESPNGRWDRATSDAMLRYQQENGFSPTGLPEAKPLMKLGLGPHPLPPGLAPHPPQLPTQAKPQGKTSAASASQPAKKSSSYQ